MDPVVITSVNDGYVQETYKIGKYYVRTYSDRIKKLHSVPCISCTCPDWIVRHVFAGTHCKHIQELIDNGKLLD